MGRRRIHAVFILYKTLGYPELGQYDVNHHKVLSLSPTIFYLTNLSLVHNHRGIIAHAATSKR